jgi:hypothetical protein
MNTFKSKVVLTGYEFIANLIISDIPHALGGVPVVLTGKLTTKAPIPTPVGVNYSNLHQEKHSLSLVREQFLPSPTY